MRSVPVEHVLKSIGPEAEVRFTLRDIPLDELFLTVHESRFTGTIDVGAMPEVDRVFFRGGAVVGVTPYRHLDAQLLGEILVEMRSLSRGALEDVLSRQGSSLDGVLFGQMLMQKRLIDEETLSRACAEQARRRVFHLFDVPEAPVLVREGLKRLARFHPTHVDLRPAIAYGLVVRSDEKRKQAMARKAANKRVRLISPYDEHRNGYGLPPPVLGAMRLLSAKGSSFDKLPCLPGLDPETTAGLLLLLERMSLLRFEDVSASQAPPSLPR